MMEYGVFGMMSDGAPCLLGLYPADEKDDAFADAMGEACSGQNWDYVWVGSKADPYVRAERTYLRFNGKMVSLTPSLETT